MLWVAVAEPARAEDALAWTWDRRRTYALSASVALPMPLTLMDETNEQARITGYDLKVTTTCAPKGDLGKKSAILACSLSGLELKAVPVDQDAGFATDVITAAQEQLRSGEIEMEIGYDGRIRQLHLTGVKFQNQTERTNLILVTDEVVVERAFAAFDLQLPKGTASASRPTSQSGSWPTHLPTLEGTFGPAPVIHAVTGPKGNNLALASQGGGVIVWGATADGPTAAAYTLVLNGSAVFDPREHAIVDREYRADAPPNQSSATSSISGGTYVQYVTLSMVGSASL
jgi:hypothetical protein